MLYLLLIVHAICLIIVVIELILGLTTNDESLGNIMRELVLIGLPTTLDMYIVGRNV